MDGSTPHLMPTGIEGLDEVLGGGLERRRTYLIEGKPGAGKTTLALHWLMDGLSRGERCLHISLSETREELLATLASHGWAVDEENLVIVELNVARENLQRDSQYTMFHPSEVELGETIERVLAEVERFDPDRVVLDSLSEVRLLAQEPLRYRRQVLALKQFLADLECTTLLISQALSDHHQEGLHSLVHGVISLHQTTMAFGAKRRELQVVKMRGRAFHEGLHSFAIRRGGFQVFPRLSATEAATVEGTALASGTSGLDVLLGGGITRGTSTMFMGPTGAGKSSVMAQYVAAALERGQPAVVLAFDERRELFLARSASLGLDFGESIEAGLLKVQQVDPAQLSPGEFAHLVRQAVERDGVELVVIDSLNGFLSSMPEERFLLIHLHEVLGYLAGRGVTSIMTITQPGIFGNDGRMAVNASYLADAIVLFRYFEARGEVMKAVSVLKKRLGGHEKSIRELRIGSSGIHVGEPLDAFQGILSGVPVLHGAVQYTAHDDDF